MLLQDYPSYSAHVQTWGKASSGHYYEKYQPCGKGGTLKKNVGQTNLVQKNLGPKT